MSGKHGRLQEFFQRGKMFLVGKSLTFVYKAKLSAKKFNVSYVLHFSGYLG